MRRFVLPALLVLCAAALPQDTDGDGLSDFEERHKYFTNPDAADSDSDGVPDGDWNERREYAYTIRTIVQVSRPAAAISDDYQDARLLDETDGYIEIEVVHYPLNTVADAIAGSRDWRDPDASVREYLASTTTTNWDAEMRTKLLAELKTEGIDVDTLDDREVVEKTSAWLMKRSKSISDFTTFFTHFPDGKPTVFPGLEEAVEENRGEGSLEEVWQRELFAKGMFEKRTHGSCTSSAIYLQGGMRAVGIPTRTILCIPAVDASDDREMEMARKNLTHHRVRQTILGALQRIRGSWSSHTFNEVYVGGRWRRLNYQRLGQNTLDPGFFGLMTHVLTVRDWADADAARTIGRRQGLGRGDDVFGHRNPYSALTISDRFGRHAKIDNEPIPGPKRITVKRAVWYDSPARPEKVSMKLKDPEKAGHVLLEVAENEPGGGLAQYATFWREAGKEFALRAEGHPEVKARADRGYWASGWFYLRIEPDELGKMRTDAEYRLVPLQGETEYAWAVADDVRLKRGEVKAFRTLTIEDAVFSDSERLDRSLRNMLAKQGLALLLRPKEWEGWEPFKRFTEEADGLFYLEAEGHPRIEFHTGTGGITGNDGEIRFALGQVSREPARGVRYRLRARNDAPERRWIVPDDLVVIRK